jgi:hypothetical protein
MRDLIRKSLVTEIISEKMVLKEGAETSEGLKYHINEGLTLSENVYRIYSDEFFNLINEVRNLYDLGLIHLNEEDKWIVNTDIGKTAQYDGDTVWLDIPFLIESEISEIGLSSVGVDAFMEIIDENPNLISKLGFNSRKDVERYIQHCTISEWDDLRDEITELLGDTLNEAEYRGRKVKLNSPFRTPGGSKKFGVYVKSPSGNVKIVRFGDPNLKIRNNDPGARKSFRARHKCDQKKDKTTAGYWSCNVSRYRKKLGIKSSSPW